MSLKPPINPTSGASSVLDSLTARVTTLESGGGFATLVAAPTGVAATDRASIAAAIASLPSSGGSLRFRSGFYRIDPALPQITVPVVIEGAAAGIVPATLAGTVLQFAAGVKGFDLGAAAQYSAIRDLYLQSLSSVAGADHGIQSLAHATEISGVVVDGFGGNGVHIDTTLSGNANCSVVERVRAVSNKGHGFFISGPNSQAMEFDTCDATSNGGWGFRNVTSAKNVFRSPHCDANVSGAFYDNGSSNKYDEPYVESGVGSNVTFDAASNGIRWDAAGTYTDPAITDLGTNNRIRRAGYETTLQVGSLGQVIKSIKTFNVSVDLPSIAANTTINHDIATTAGLVNAATDRPIFQGVDSLAHGLLFQGCPLAPATDTIRLRVSNVTAAAIDAAAATFYFTIVRI